SFKTAENVVQVLLSCTPNCKRSTTRGMRKWSRVSVSKPRAPLCSAHERSKNVKWHSRSQNAQLTH
ncbi:hypothetical protein GCK32_011644, partial [Trichostrongylus colubriformis]